MTLQSNPQLELALEYVRNTHKNIFLTGKAGTGKTTFLRQLKVDQPKRMAVVAPTGVAAINAGGMTIHSFFQLPFGPYVPGSAQDPTRQRHFTREKIRLIQSVDLLVIDEISMVRADTLDAIDQVLRRYRDRFKPFGGVQLLMIGDLNQLPPVVKDEDWHLLRDHYQTAYFFGSHALRDTDPVRIELLHIYRQADATFIDLLNKVRDNQMDAAVLDTLNSRYVPNFQPKPEEPYITLTAHNAAAQQINAEKLTALQYPSHQFKALVEGEFPESSFPADPIFECKQGAQVMFLKNDLQREKRYFNGKIGQITRFGDNTIYVRCPGEAEDIEVAPSEWLNLKYSLNETTKEVTEEQIGKFVQYPLKLAWAITIHKSQGLTFERAIIDAQAAFAHGQVYVALSRCKSFEGIVLRSKIAYSSVKTDHVVRQYTETADKNAPNEGHLSQSKAAYQQALLLELFDFSRMRRQFIQLNRLFLEHEHTLNKDAAEHLKTLESQAATQVFDLAERFKPQIRQYFAEGELPETNEALQARLQKASAWFTEKLGKDLFPPIREIAILTDNKIVRKAVLEALEALQKEIFSKNACFTALQPAFSASRYLRAKTDAELDFRPATPTKAGSTQASIPKNLAHPKLFSRLLQWREATADMLDVPIFEVLPTPSLIELSQFLPLSLPSLKRIKGVGKAKVGRFGPELIALVQAYCTENKIYSGQISEAMDTTLAPPPKQDTKALSFELFKSGKTIDEVAQARGLVTSSIEGHLAHYIRTGELDVTTLMDMDTLRTIEAFFEEHQTFALGQAKAHFGEAYSYRELRWTVAWMEYCGHGGFGQESP